MKIFDKKKQKTLTSSLESTSSSSSKNIFVFFKSCVKQAPTMFVEKVGVLARIKAIFNTLKIRKIADL